MFRFLLLFASIILLIASPAAAQIYTPKLAQAVDISFEGWSADSTWVAFFTHTQEDLGDDHIPDTGELHFFNMQTSERCIYENRQPDARTYGVYEYNRWLADGSYLYLHKDGTVERFTPCQEDHRDLTDLFPDAPYQINDSSPNGRYIVFNTGRSYSIYEPDTDRVRLVEGLGEPLGLGNLTWSADGTQFALSLNDYPLVYVVDVETAQARLIYEDPKPIQGPEGSTAYNPIWLDDETLFLEYMPSYRTMALKLDGSILDWTFDGVQYQLLRGQRIPETNKYYALLLNPTNNELALYRSWDNSLEALPDDNLDPENYQFSPDATMLLAGLGTLWVRPLEPPGSLMEWVLVYKDYPSFVWSADGTRMALYTIDMMFVYQMPGMLRPQIISPTDYGRYQALGWSPDSEQLAVEARFLGGLPDHEESNRQSLMIFRPRLPQTE